MKREIIERGEGRRFAIGDIHGCAHTFTTLIQEKIELERKDQLFLLGDYVNRGPRSEQVLDEIERLLEDGYHIYPIRGNHEDKYLKKTANVKPRHQSLIEAMPYHYETEDFIFVHAGLNFTIENPFEDTNTMKWGLGFYVEPDEDFLQGKHIIHGHTITSLSDIFDAVMDRATFIPLDNGCYRALDYEEVAYGTLVALDLDEMKMIVQKNMDRAN